MSEAAAPSYSFRALGTEILVHARTDLRPWFGHVERTLSRFDPESALSRLNRSQGLCMEVPPLLYLAIAKAIRAAEATDWAYNPAILDALESAGYGRSFEQGPTPTGPAVPAPRPRGIVLLPALQAVRLPPGVRLDLGGIGKGLAVDEAMGLLGGEPRAVIDAGGDIAVRTTPEDLPVLVDVADPFQPELNLATLSIRRGAVATSSTLGRTWGAGLHHIIDPRTGRPAESDLVAATVVARSVAKAEVLAKACIVLGAQAGLALLDRHRAIALLVTHHKDQLYTSGWEELIHAAPQ